jgi:hypothetical protein
LLVGSTYLKVNQIKGIVQQTAAAGSSGS